MEHPFRRRPGVGGDVVYEIRSWLWRWWFNSSNVGWIPYANAASARNRHAVKLNEMAAEMEEELEKYAKAEAELLAEKTDHRGVSYSHLGISPVTYMEKKSLKDMLPICDEPLPLWQKFVSKSVVVRVLQKHNAFSKKDKKQEARKGRTIVGREEDVRNHPEAFAGDNAENILSYRAEKKDSAGKQNQQKGNKKGWKSLRGDNHQYEGESQNEWDQRLREKWKDENDD